MALFHFHVTQVKRSAGQSAIASAAYRAGERLYSDRYGEYSDYTRKDGVVYSEILLPPNAPPAYADRQTLWNAVEAAERGKNAQLAYSFDIALQNEFSLAENIALAGRFLSEQFVSRGMVVDYAVHEPDRKDGGIKNPHFHVLCPIRPLDAQGNWGLKQRRVYALDEAGNRVRDEVGNEVFRAVPTTDWGSPETLEAWREAWAELCNEMFAEKGLAVRIDHRSFLRQGMETLPTVHEGPSVRAMEAKGIPTEKGGLNRWIRATNAMLRELRGQIASLLGWIGELKEELAAQKSPGLAELLGAYYGARNAASYSQRGKAANLKKYADAVNYLTEQKLSTVEDLEARVTAHREEAGELKSGMDSRNRRREEIRELLRQAENYARYRPVFEEMNAIRWKGKREKFKQEHDSDLRLFFMARRKLEPHFTAGGKLPLTAWRREDERLEQENKAAYAAYRPLRDDLMKLYQMKSCVDTALRQKERAQQPRRERHRQEAER